MKNKIRCNKYIRKFLVWLLKYCPECIASRIVDFLYGDDEEL